MADLNLRKRLGTVLDVDKTIEGLDAAVARMNATLDRFDALLDSSGVRGRPRDSSEDVRRHAEAVSRVVEPRD
jgi:hypothetical protein